MLIFYIFAVCVYSCDITAYDCNINYFDCRNEYKSVYYDYSIDLMLDNITVYTITRYIIEDPAFELCVFTPKYPSCSSLQHTKNHIQCYYCSDLDYGFALSPNCDAYVEKRRTDIIIGLSTPSAIILVGIIIFIIYYHINKSKNNKK